MRARYCQLISVLYLLQQRGRPSNCKVDKYSTCKRAAVQTKYVALPKVVVSSSQLHIARTSSIGAVGTPRVCLLCPLFSGLHACGTDPSLISRPIYYCATIILSGSSAIRVKHCSMGEPKRSETQEQASTSGHAADEVLNNANSGAHAAPGAAGAEGDAANSECPFCVMMRKGGCEAPFKVRCRKH